MNKQQKTLKNFPNGITVETFCGNVLEQLSEQELINIAICFKDVFNDPDGPWKEAWTLQSAIEEIRKPLTQTDHRNPILTLLKANDKLIGFGIGVLTDLEHLIEDDMPHSLDSSRKKRGVRNIRESIEIREQFKILILREIAVIKKYRSLWVPNILYPISKIALENEYDAGYFWTRKKSKIFEYGIGVKWTNIYTFKSIHAVAMYGFVSDVFYFSKNLSCKNTRKAAFKKLINNKNIFFKK